MDTLSRIPYRTVNTIVALAALLALWGCNFNDISKTTLPDKEEFEITCTLKELCAQQGRISDELTASGIVLTSDSTGNFFREILVAEFLDKDTTVMRLPLYFYDTYSLFPKGNVIAIKGKGLFMGVDNGLNSLGYTPLDGSSIPEAIPTPTLALDHIQNSGIAKTITPQSITIDELSTNNIGHCVVLDNVYFTETIGSLAGEKQIAQLNSENTINLYTSAYCSFANDSVPEGLLTITAIVECYDDEIQLKVVDEMSIAQKK